MHLSETVKGCNLFQDMTPEQIAKFFSCANPVVRTFAAGETVLCQNEILAHILVILSGTLSLSKNDADGNHSLVGTLGPCDVYGQMSVFGDFPQNTLTMQATSPCTILYLSKNLFYQTCSNACPSHQLIIKNMIALLANQANLLDRKINYLTAKNLHSQIARFLLEEYQRHGQKATFDIPYNRETLADYFGVQRPSLSRALTQLKADGLIDYYRSTFKLLNIDSLRAYVQ